MHRRVRRHSSTSISTAVTGSFYEPSSPVLVPSDLLVWDPNGDASATEAASSLFPGSPMTQEQFCKDNNITVTSSSATSRSGGYKIMGICERQQALDHLDDVSAVLFHEKQSGRDSRPLRIAVRLQEKKILLDVLSERLSAGDRLWGIADKNRKLGIGFRSKESLMEFYSIYPEAAIVFYFDD